MYKIWFKFALGGNEMSSECATIEDAQKLWDILNKHCYMMCTRP